MIKKLFLLTIIFFGFSVFEGKVEAQNPEDLLPEPTCIAYNATGGFGTSPCNTTCQRKCIDAGRSCRIGDPSDCAIILFDANFPEVTQVVRPAFNPFSVELCPDPEQRPPDDPYCTLTVVRLGFYAVISIMIFVLVILAFWVVWERSTAADKPEKVEKAASIAKNAVIGALITFFFVAIVQVVALLVGLTGSLFDISIVPQPRVVGNGERCDAGLFVVCEQGLQCRGVPAGPEVHYYCRP